MGIAEIPIRAMLGAMFKELDLPKPTFDFAFNDMGQVTVTVHFYPSTARLKDYGQVSLSSNPSKIVHTAENQVATEALKYMHSCANKVLKHYNYEALKKKEQADGYLFRQLLKKDRQLKRRTSKIKYLSKAFSSFIDDVSEPCAKIMKIARGNLEDPESGLNGALNSVLLHIDDAACDLDLSTSKASDLVQKIGTYPCPPQSAFSGYDEIPDYYGPTEFYGKSSFDDEFIYDTDE